MKYLFLLVVFLLNCGFEKDELPTVVNKVVVEGETKYKYKLVVVSPCSFHIKVKAFIPDSYAHYREDLHQLAALFGDENKLRYGRGQFSKWDNFELNIPCGACTMELSGVIYLLDDRIDLIPWGCGSQRPPLQINEVYSSFIPPIDVVLADKSVEVPWSDSPPKEYNTKFSPDLKSMNSICDGYPVLFDLQPACKVLFDAGVIK